MEPEHQPELAGWGARAGAAVIDNLLLTIPLALAVGLTIAAAADEDVANDVDASFWVPIVVLFVIGFVGPFVYFAVLNGNERGQTLGKRVTGVRVRRMDGAPLGIGRALARYVFTFALGLFIGPFVIVDYLWPLWDGQNQALHDKVVDSIVVKA